MHTFMLFLYGNIQNLNLAKNLALSFQLRRLETEIFQLFRFVIVIGSTLTIIITLEGH